jgi:hypothetical protein
VTVPAKLSSTGKRQDKYFDKQDDAEKFIAETLVEREEHGKQAVTAKERQWITFARTELGSLELLPEVIRHWKKTAGEAVTEITAKNAVSVFTKSKSRAGKRTLSDIKYRLNAFADVFGERLMHQVHSGEIENFIDAYKHTEFAIVGWL